MNDLHDALHQHAEAQRFSPVDLEAVLASGTRRRRRRRATGVVGSLAALALVGGTAYALAARPGSTDLRVSPATGVAAPISYATGSVIHSGDDTIDVGHPIYAYVQTDEGFVVLADDGTVWRIRSASSAAEKLGEATMPNQLATDGRWVGWANRDGADVVYRYTDLTTGHGIVDRELLDPDYSREEGAYLAAIDGGTAYTIDARGVVSTPLIEADTEPRGSTVLDEHMPENQVLIDARAGVLARYREGVEIGSSWQTTHPVAGIMESGGVLSPDGTMYAPDADTIKVVTVDGRDVTPDLGPTYTSFSTAYQWLDANTVAVEAMDESTSSMSLVRCTISSGDCTTVVAEATRLDSMREGGFQLPVGHHIGD